MAVGDYVLLTHSLEKLFVVLLGVHLPCSVEGHVCQSKGEIFTRGRRPRDGFVPKLNTKWRAGPRGNGLLYREDVGSRLVNEQPDLLSNASCLNNRKFALWCLSWDGLSDDELWRSRRRRGRRRRRRKCHVGFPRHCSTGAGRHRVAILMTQFLGGEPPPLNKNMSCNVN